MSPFLYKSILVWQEHIPLAKPLILLLLLLFLSRKRRYEILSLSTILKKMQANTKGTPEPGSSAHSNSSLPSFPAIFTLSSQFVDCPKLKLASLPQSAPD